MAESEFLSDDYVASLLTKDAKESVIKYSAMGMEAFLPSKAPANKPKPNTRFLRAIIKETDSHNAALLAKEAAESKARLQNLVTKETHSGLDIRRRQLGHITAHLTGGSTKRPRDDQEVTRSSNQKRRRDAVDEELQDLAKSAKRKLDEDDDRKKSRSSREDRHSNHRSHRRRRSRSEEHSRRVSRYTDDSSRRRSPSPKDHKSLKSRRSHQSSEHRTSLHSAKQDIEEEIRSSRKMLSSKSNEKAMQERLQKRKSGESLPEGEDNDSDPLDEIVGPRPPPKVRSRGRGVISTASGIDDRFSSNYDPSVDVQLDFDEENDWDQALEALKDRQKWRQQGAERLRAAGFTEEEIEKWEKGGEKKETDVKWAKKGEGREWDRGKVLVDDGDNDFVKGIDINYGRLKGT